MQSIEHHGLEYKDMHEIYGYWGKPTSTLDWCELNYQYSFYIAEFWNTISNFFFIGFAIYGLYRSIKQNFEWRFHLQCIMVGIVGIGSAMFHGTLQLVSQQCDETPMIWSMLVAIYITYFDEINQCRIPNNVTACILTIFGILWAILHAIYRFTTSFQLFFAILSIFCAVRMHTQYYITKNENARAVARAYIFFFLLAASLWSIDFHYCHAMHALPVNPQFHAWWHFLMSLASYTGPVFSQYIRLEQLQRKADVTTTYLGVCIVIMDEEVDKMHETNQTQKKTD